MKQVVADSNGSVSWTYRHWPIHQNSLEKLVAAECVAKLKGNDAFWKYVDLVFGMLNTGAPSITDQL
jgi:protein-disulfide isomerase